MQNIKFEMYFNIFLEIKVYEGKGLSQGKGKGTGFITREVFITKSSSQRKGKTLE